MASNTEIPASQLPDVMSEAGFHVAWFIKPLLHQFADSFLSGRNRLPEARNASHSGAISVSGGKLCHVDEPLEYIPNGVFIEGGNPGCERVNKFIEVGIGQ